MEERDVGTGGDMQNHALRLFLEGYRAEYLREDHVLMQDPRGKRYWINTLFGTCTCQETELASSRLPCEHLLGFAGLLCEQQAYEEALIATLEAQNDFWGLTLENDSVERSLREIGVCEF
jgi:hypothetical protein